MSQHGECVKCGEELFDPWTCNACGWKARRSKGAGGRSASETFPLGYQQCEWISNRERCSYPGSLSLNTHEGGPYYCRLHFGCDDPVFGAQIVEASRDYVRPAESEALAAHNARARELMVAQGLAQRAGESAAAWRRRMIFWMKERTKFRTFEDAA